MSAVNVRRSSRRVAVKSARAGIHEDSEQVMESTAARFQTLPEERSTDEDTRKREATVSPDSSKNVITKKARKTVTFAGSTTDAVTRAALREERSRRRRKTRKPPVASHAGNAADVVRVPMRTGTLLLYRGAKPRAVFVRRV